MSDTHDPAWLDWSRRLASIAQSGLTYARDPYDIERYTQLRQIAAEMLAGRGGLPLQGVLAMLGGESGHATPKVDVRGVVFREDRVLLVRERSDGRWSLPGGWADPGETPAANVEREIREESGFTARASRILALYDRSRHASGSPHVFHIYKLFMLCTLTGGAAQPSIETDAVEFFGEAELPELSSGRVTRLQLERMFEHRRNPQLPADFDR